MRLAQEGVGEIMLVDIASGLAGGKALDLEDAAYLVKCNYKICASDNIQTIKDSDIVVVTAGLIRKPGMTREDLLSKNAAILKSISVDIKKFSRQAIVIVVTNPLDLMTRLVLENTGFDPGHVLGMGVTLDAGRFANLISKELNIPVTDIEPCVIGSHGEGMLPLARLTKIKGVALDEFLDEKKIAALVKKTCERGQEIVSLLGSGSAYFAPSAAIAEIVRAVAKDEKRALGTSAYLNGEYGIKDACIGVPCRLGRSGIEQIIELDLEAEELDTLRQAAEKLKSQYKNIL